MVTIVNPFLNVGVELMVEALNTVCVTTLYSTCIRFYTVL